MSAHVCRARKRYAHTNDYCQDGPVYAQAIWYRKGTLLRRTLCEVTHLLSSQTGPNNATQEMVQTVQV